MAKIINLTLLPRRFMIVQITNSHKYRELKSKICFECFTYPTRPSTSNTWESGIVVTVV